MQTSSAYAVPDSVLPYVGRITDVDTHESTPSSAWRELYGPVVDDLVKEMTSSALSYYVKDTDDAEINAETVWKLKNAEAPGSWDFSRRLAVMDLTGVQRQIIYPGGLGGSGLGLYASADEPQVWKSITGDRRGYARKLINAYNEWCFRVAKHSDRMRPATILLGDDPDDLVQQARRFLKNGIRAVWLPSATPPGGVSPAHPALDPLWDILEAGNTPLLSHVGDGNNFPRTLEWRNAPAFQGYMVGSEFSLDPWTMQTIHLGGQNLAATMVLGGVFDRHPRLRLGFAELGASWIGPLAASMDMWNQHTRLFNQEGVSTVRLRHKPSDYVRRNIRISGFDIEDIGGYIDRFGLEETYCYASDFPHVEGGKSPMSKFSSSIAHLGPDVMRKFYVENGRWLLPD